LSLPFGLLIGMSLAWLARAELARSEVLLVLARPFLVVLGFAALVYAPVVAYFLLAHGDWAYLYVFRFSQIPSAVDLILVVLAAAQIPLGFALAAPWATAKRGPALLRVTAALGVVLVVLCAISARRLAVSGSYAQVHGAFGVAPLGRSALGRGVLLSWIALLAGYGWTARVLRTNDGANVL
jgi:hypothetical protein